ncbi:MAG: peptidoglycan editing factor PgeF [Dongiaceae bacterium]
MERIDRLDALAGIRHGFFGREGGVSDGLYASLNCGYGSGDAPDKVTANRDRAAGRLDLTAARVVTGHQTHSARVATVETPWPRDAAPAVDALVTARPGIGLGVLTADCAPVLLADPAARVVGAAHAGWRGALGGVLEATVAAMAALGARPERIGAAIGPCIGPASYEVGPEFPAPFLAESAENARFFRPAERAGHLIFDLPGYVAARLARLGIASGWLGRDSLAESDRFFSYRRSTLDGHGVYGRGLSLIALED